MTTEKTIRVFNGWLMLAVDIAVLFAGIGLIVGFVYSAIDADKTHELPNFYYLVGGILTIVLAIFSSTAISRSSRTLLACSFCSGLTMAPCARADFTGRTRFISNSGYRSRLGTLPVTNSK